jgi:Leucine-rich repeat (LRR) protein
MKRSLSFFVLFIIFYVLSGYTHVLYAQVSEEDSLALVALYDSTDGENWIDNGDWLIEDVGEWNGVTVIDMSVILVQLIQNNLAGTIPPELATLTELIELNFRRNYLTGSIPPELGSMTNLEILNLGWNDLSGSIPPALGNLDSLQCLYLYMNDLTGSIPPELGNLDSLRHLYLFDNQLEGSIPAELGNLAKLTHLYLYGNQLSGSIPAELGNLDSLIYLYLDHNQITDSIPSELGRLTSLTELNLHANQLEGSIPPELGGLANLTRLSLYNNQLNGPIPAELGGLANLIRLDVNDNQLTGSIPPELGSMTNLEFLDFGGNQLTDSIPSSFGDLDNLTSLYLYENQLTGAIPPELGNLDNLIYLYLSNNQLTDTIPSELGNLTGLTELSLNGNQLEGSIPPELGNLINLTTLNLGYNQLTDSIPSDIGELVNVTQLYLYNNQLSGAVPSEFSNMTNLTSLYINNNYFTDLPDLSSMPSLTTLNIANNRFTFEDIEPNIGIGNFTYSPQDSVGETQNIHAYTGSSLILSVDVGGTQNQYQWYKNDIIIPGASQESYTMNPVSPLDSGSYHCQISNSIATELTLYSRKMNVSVLSGTDTLALVALYDSTNGSNWTNNTGWLSGPLSEWFGVSMTGDRVTGIQLNNNHLVGSLPSEIGILDSIETIELSENQLAGSVPLSIANLEKLGNMDISSNRLDDLPDLSAVTTLTDLSIGHNLFTFEDIEPNIDIGNFTYSPQDSVGEMQDTTCEEGQNLVLEIIVGGTANHYQWFKDDVEIAGSDSSALVMESLTQADSGSYRCEITNDIATELILYSRPVDVHVTPASGIADDINDLPTEFRLIQNYPNPFNPVTKISYSLPKTSFVILKIYDMLGREVKTLVHKWQNAGNYSINFNANDLSSGIYFYKLQVGNDYTETKKMVLMR